MRAGDNYPRGTTMMWQAVSIDPGAKDTAFAVWASFRLKACAVVENGDELHERMRAVLLTYVAHTCYVESQFIDPGTAVRDKDILDVCYWGGRAAGIVNATHTVQVAPTTWKGQQPKRVTAAQVWRRLDEEERAIVTRAVAAFTNKPLALIMQAIRDNRMGPVYVKRTTDLFDAMGIGLFFTRRF